MRQKSHAVALLSFDTTLMKQRTDQGSMGKSVNLPFACKTESFGDGKSTGLIIDESSFAKQGKMYVGTARQWLGGLGKVNNGQVAVFGALATGRFVSPFDARLYLP